MMRWKDTTEEELRRTEEEKEAEHNRIARWHPHFCIRSKSVEGQWVWLEWIEKRYVHPRYDAKGPWPLIPGKWEYRFPQKK